MDDVLKEMQEKYYEICPITGLTVFNKPHVSCSDLQRCIDKIKTLQRKNKKLKSLLLLTDPVVSMNEVNGIALEQWQEYIKCFPDEA